MTIFSKIQTAASNLIRPLLHDWEMKAIVATTVTLAAGVLAAPAAQANKYNFWINNQTAHSIVDLYISESSLEFWGNDLTEHGVLLRGDALAVRFGNPSPRACLYDIMANFADGSTFTEFRVNVCSDSELSTYTITHQAPRPTRLPSRQPSYPSDGIPVIYY